MTVSTRTLPIEEDAGALVQRYQQRIRAELLKKAADETSWAPRWRWGSASSTHTSGAGAPTLVERMVSVLQAFTDQRHFAASGLLLAFVTASTSVALLVGAPGLLPWIGLLALGLIVVVGISQPVRWAAVALTGVAAVGLTVATMLDTPSALLPGLLGAFGLIVTGLVADRYGLACRQEQEDRQQTKRAIEDMQPVDEDAGVLKWPHASLVFDRELARAHRYGHPLTLLRVVVERWDVIRVGLGPVESAEVLGEVGALLVSSSRVVDVVAYHGDAKFDLLLPDTAELGAAVVARRISAHVSPHEGVKLRVGVAPVVGQEGGIDDLIQQGEEAAMLAERINRPFAVHGVEAAMKQQQSRRLASSLRRR
jgi:hypothetical protein